MSAQGVSETHDEVLAGEVPGRPVDEDLLRVIHRVAHREYLLPAPAWPTRTTHSRSSVRRRPVAGVDAVRPSRGTTARKVTWSR